MQAIRTFLSAEHLFQKKTATRRLDIESFSLCKNRQKNAILVGKYARHVHFSCP
jgi:hypothetical protein